MRNRKNKRLKYCYLLLTFLVVNFNKVQSQTVITLTQPESGNIDHAAQYNVDYQVGYQYSPTSTQGMHGHIAPSLPVNTPYSSGGFGGGNDVENRSLDYNLTVGSINGSEGVSSTGGATYSIPIAVPLGTANMEPSLALTYNSQSNYGIAGRGWNISGLSAITRIPKTIHYDGYSDGVSFTSNDDYAIDGSRFELVGSQPVIPKENPAYKITPNGNIGGSPEWYLVETQDGMIMEFGNTSDSRFMTDDNSEIILWNVNKVYDKYGNYIEYKYNNSDRHPRIEKILYTGNSNMGLTPYNEVNFYYNFIDNDEENVSYIEGSSIKTKYILRSISTKTHGTIVNEYELSYYKNFYSLLQSIKLKGRKGDEYNSTLFQYGNNVTPTVLEEDWITISGADIISGQDFNNDGKSDIIKWDRDYINFQANFTSWTGYVSNGNGTFSQYIQGTVPPGYWKVDDNSGKLSVPGRTFDFNGDGYGDVLLTKLDIFQSYIKIEEIKVELVNGLNSTTTLNLFSGVQLIDPERYIYTGDFDGDGKDEIILFSRPTQNSNYNVDFIDYNNGTYTKKPISNSSLKYLPDAEKVYVIDFNGDGKLELMMMFPHPSIPFISTCEIFELSVDPQNGNVSSTRIFYSGIPSYPSQNHEIYPGDFNGDGKTDILTYLQGNWQIGFSNGLEFLQTNISSLNIHQNYLDKVEIGDYNGDGKSDVFYYYPNFNTSNDEFDLYLSIGKEFLLKEHHVSNVHLNKIITGDFNGDGKQEIFDQPNISTPVKLFSFYKESKEWLLHKISDGMGRLVLFDYSPLTLGGSLYTKGNSSLYPYRDIQPAINVVSELKVDNGIGGYSKMNYFYEGAVVNLEGKGFLGFTSMKQKNVDLNTWIHNHFELNTNYARFLQKEKDLYNGNTASFDIKTTYDFEIVKDGGTGIIWTKLNSVVENNLLLGITTTTNNTWDLHDRAITKSVVNVGSQESITNQFTYNIHGSYSGWLWLSTANEIKTTNRAGQPPVTRRVDYYYNSLGKLTQKVNDLGNPKAVTTNYNNLNGFGLAQDIVISANGVLALTKHLKYDSKARFIDEETNSLHQKVNYTYNQILGVVSSQVGIDGLQTSYEYDGFGRLIKTSTPDGLITNTPISWEQSANSAFALYSETVEQQGKPIAKKLFDKLGREVETQIESFNGGIIYTNNTYDNYGNQNTTTLPYTQSQTPVVSISTFDQAYKNRILSISNSIGNTSFSYSFGQGASTITTTFPDNTTKTKVTDATGKLIAASDNGGNLNYTYNSHGLQKEVKLNGINVTEMNYDDVGHQIELLDNNAGNTKYNYDAFGQLIEQTDANGSIFEMTYDVLGRLTLKEEKGASPQSRIITYKYVQTGNGINQLKSVTEDFNSFSEEYEYDNLNRITKMKETIDAKDYVTTYTYDAFNNLDQTVYPSNNSTKNEYNGFGYLTKVKLGNKVIWEGSAVNAFGQYTNTKIGNMQKVKTYDQYGLPTTIYASYQNNTPQDLTLNFDPKNGNLLTRTDLVHGTYEEFGYDVLNRLSETKVNSSSQVLTNYASNGNITDKTDAGTFTYDNNKTNAVIGISTLNANISTDEQKIEYTGFNSAYNITEGNNILDIFYGANEQRKKTVFTDGIINRTNYYLGNYEKIEIGGNTTELLYIAGGDGLAAIHVISTINSQTTTNTYYTFTDHLGTILTLTDENGVVATEQNFDAWGRYRDPQNLDFSNFTPPHQQPGFEWLLRGYTGHEYLPNFQLINMNGRMYDPIVGRMLSVDNYVQDATSTQSFNRYSYVGNNPLKYTDPDGEIAFLAVVGIVGVVSGGINWATNGASFNTKGLAHFGVGFAVGVGATIGGAALAPVLGTGVIAGSTLGVTGGFITSYTNSGISNGNWGNDAFTAGGKGALIGAFSGGLIAGVNSGLRGNNVWTGARPSNGSSIFSFSDIRNNIRSPSFNFKDAYSLRNNNFWKYGHTNVENVQFIQDANGTLQESASGLEFMTGESGVSPSDGYRIAGTTTLNPDGTFTTTINKNPHQTITSVISSGPGTSIIGTPIQTNTSYQINTLFRPTPSSYYLGGIVPRHYGSGFSNFFQIGW